MKIHRFKKGDRVQPNERLLKLSERIWETAIKGTWLEEERPGPWFVEESCGVVVDTSGFDAGESRLIFVQWEHEDEPTSCSPVNITSNLRRTIWQRLMEDDR